MRIGNIYYISKGISSLNGRAAMDVNIKNIVRKRTEILIIDDEEFILLDPLRRHSFSINHKKDIDDIKDIEPYSVVLCDIRGVGKFLKSQYEGAYVIKEAKVMYPNKQIIAYTASSFDANYNEFLSHADAIVPKGTALEDWVSLLDAQLLKCVNPTYQWEKMRDALLKANVETVRVAQIEAEYVKAVEKKNFSSFEKLYSEDSSVSKLITEFMSTLLVKLLTGGLAK